ncbi:MAG: hypothetical protein HC877_07280 [Thioploca sp.]|nr:hypothetical protein [Thioploca sp.]
MGLESFNSCWFYKIWHASKTYCRQYHLKKLEPACQTATWETYEFPNEEARIFVEDSYIDRIGCFNKLYYNGKNLIGMTSSEIYIILGNPDDIDEMDIWGISFNYKSLALSLFLEDGRVESAFCSGSWED